MQLFKLAQVLSAKYAIDQYELPSDTDEKFVPTFESGDIVEWRGKKAVYISANLWTPHSTGEALIQLLDKEIPTLRNYHKPGQLTYAKEKELTLIKKKD